MAEQTRYELIQAVAEAKKQRLNLRDRREYVIAHAANANLAKEPQEVKDKAIKKYWNTERLNLDSQIPVLIVAQHHFQPSEGELFTLLHEKFSDKSAEKIQTVINVWLAAPDDQKPHKTVDETDPDLPLYQSIYKIRRVNESYILSLAKEISGNDKDRLPFISAKKSRMFADSNRPSFYENSKEVGKEEEFILSKEYPTSIRASWYFILEKFQKNKPFMQVTLHGMTDRLKKDGSPAYDIVIGGCNPQKGEAGQFVDETILAWFAQKLATKLMEEKIIVAIDRQHVPLVETFQGGKKSKADRVGEELSGAGLGLEHFRKGGQIKPANTEKTFTIPGFGDNFNTIQLEISKRVRSNDALRQKLAHAIRELCLEFPNRFP